MGKQPARKTRSTGKKRRKKKSKGLHLGASFWIMLILLVGVIFYFTHDDLEKVFSNTKLFSKLKQEDKPLVVEDIESPGSKTGTSAGKSTVKKEVPKDDGKNTIIKMGNQVVSDKDKPAPKKQEPPKQIQSTFRDSALYFVFFSPNGDIKLSKINRKVQVAGCIYFNERMERLNQLISLHYAAFVRAPGQFQDFYKQKQVLPSGK